MPTLGGDLLKETLGENALHAQVIIEPATNTGFVVNGVARAGAMVRDFPRNGDPLELSLTEGAYQVTIKALRSLGEREQFKTFTSRFQLDADYTWAQVIDQATSAIPVTPPVLEQAEAAAASAQAAATAAVAAKNAALQAAGDATALVPKVDELDETVETFTATSALNEELVQNAILPTIAAAAGPLIYVAPYPSILSRVLLASATAVAASDTNYWTIAVQKSSSGGAWATIATRTTKATGGEALTAGKAWTFDTAAFSAAGLVDGDVVRLNFTPTGSPAPITTPVVTFRAPPGEAGSTPTMTPLAVDTFTRGDSTTTLGSTEAAGSAPAQAWATSGTGTWGISANRAYFATAGNKVAVVDVADADVTVQAKIATIGGSGSAGLAFRYQDASNYLLVTATTTSVGVYKVEAGGSAVLLFSAGGGINAGDSLRVVTNGANITVYVDYGSTGTWENAGTGTSSLFQTATKHGIRGSGAGHTFDDFAIYA